MNIAVYKVFNDKYTEESQLPITASFAQSTAVHKRYLLFIMTFAAPAAPLWNKHLALYQFSHLFWTSFFFTGIDIVYSRVSNSVTFLAFTVWHLLKNHVEPGPSLLGILNVTFSLLQPVGTASNTFKVRLLLSFHIQKDITSIVAEYDSLIYAVVFIVQPIFPTCRAP